jgi:hypothetical protein
LSVVAERLSAANGQPIAGVHVAPTFEDKPAWDLDPEVTNARGIARFRSGWPYCVARGFISGLFPRRQARPFIPYEFRLEASGFERKVLAAGSGEWVSAEQLPSDLGAKLVFREVALRSVP